MKLKIFKKKIETVLFKRIYSEKKYIVFFSKIKNDLHSSNSYNILTYSLKHSLQKNLNQSLVNNFLKSSFFLNVNDLNSFIKKFKLNTNLIYFIKFKNLYIYNFDSEFKTKFDSINIDSYIFVSRLQKLLLNWIPLLKEIVKDSSK
jgi:hypothetical protein